MWRRCVQQPWLRRGWARAGAGAGACVLAATPLVFAVRAESQLEVKERSTKIGGKVVREKRWLLDGSASQKLHRLRLATPGVTIVKCAPREAERLHELNSLAPIATINVYGDSQDVVEALELVPDAPNGLRLQYRTDEDKTTDRKKRHKKRKEKRITSVGHLLTEITLHEPENVNELACAGSGLFMIDENVLVRNCEFADVEIKLRGTGTLVVAPSSTSSNESEAQKPILLRNLKLLLDGAGTLAFGSHALNVVEGVRMKLCGEGSIRLAAQDAMHAGHMKAAIAGPGHVRVDANELRVEKLKSAVFGSGSAVFATNDGSCEVQRMSVLGSGSVNAANVLSKEATIKAAGYASLVMQATEQVRSSTIGSVELQYVNCMPKHIEGTSVSLTPALEGSVQVGSCNPDRLKDISGFLVEREAAFATVHATHEPHDDHNETQLGWLGRMFCKKSE